MGCVQSLVHAGSLTLKNQLLRGAMVRDKTRPKPNRPTDGINRPLILH
jgi:hypothetical protein